MVDTSIDRFAGRLAIQQRVLPAYRAPFIDMLSTSCDDGLSIFAGKPLDNEGITVVDELNSAELFSVRNYNFLHPGASLYQCWQQGIIQWLEDWNPDALIVEANARYLSTPRAIRWMHAHGRPVLGWGLGAPELGGRFSGWRMSRRKAFLLSLDGMIAYSRYGADLYRNLGFAAEKIFVAPNAVMPRPKSPPPRPDELISNRAVVLFVGRLQARKRLDMLLRACASLPEVIQPHLWIVGDGPARTDFEAVAEAEYPSAEFFGGIYGQELDNIFAAADMFVLPGTGGLAVQQAMAFGLPVIVARGDGTQSDLVRLQNGWQISPDDQDALSEALRVALVDIPRLRRMGEASYQIVSREINLERMVEVFVHALTVTKLAK